ncbi:MAG: AAA family ATPase [Lentisphaerae bacterium]|nr:AAA family ATPase [Lentisphaerota bacterium]
MNQPDTDAFQALPASAASYVQDVCSTSRRTAFLELDHAGLIRRWGGPVGDYGLASLKPGMPADEAAAPLFGMLPMRGTASVLPMVSVGGNRHADIHLVPGTDTDMVLFMDSTAEAARRASLQQYAHDLALALRERPAPPTSPPTSKPATPPSARAARVTFHGMTAASRSMHEVFRTIADLASVDSTVLILGETGTGKELVARAIHEASGRKDKPLIVMNCAGLSDSLINSQLFGHKKGAFTDAVSDQKGFFEAANEGTLLLDEIGDIPMNTQTRILRALEQKEIVRIGETVPRAVDVRVLAATHKDLDEEVRKGSFRADLLYRIRVARVSLPPLRARKDDIELLADTFLARIARNSSKPARSFSPDAVAALRSYPWPGNVRELRNAVEYALITCRTQEVSPQDLPPELAAGRDGSRDSDHGSERNRIARAIEQAGGSRDEAAALLGISRATLFRRMKACGLVRRRS